MGSRCVPNRKVAACRGEWKNVIENLVYIVYAVTALGAVALFAGLPRGDKPQRNGLLFVCMALAAGVSYFMFDAMLGSVGGKLPLIVLSLLSIGGALRMVTHPQPVYSALYFIMVILATTAILVLCGAEFLGFALAMVYAGAILVTYVFVLMLSQQSTLHSDAFTQGFDYDREAREPFWAVAAGSLLAATVGAVIVERDWSAVEKVAVDGGDNTVALGRILMTKYAISVELAAILLMVAMIGAIAVARKQIPQADEMTLRRPLGAAGREAKPY